MKYNCPFCNIKMRYRFERSVDAPPIEYLVYECEKSHCMIKAHSRYKYEDNLLSVEIILDLGENVYRVSTRYDVECTTLFKISPMKKKHHGVQYYFLKTIIEINKSIKIDLADPINSGLSVLNRLLKLRAFS